MKLDILLQNTKVISVHGDKDIEVSNICADSRQVEQGFLFAAVAGICTDGHDYIPKAIEQGATVIIYDKPMIEEFYQRVTYIRVENSAKAVAEIAAAWYDFPSEAIKLVGVTGTNGKTTVATLLYKTMRKLGFPVGLFSTVCNYINDTSYPTSLTTLDAISLNKMMRKMVDVGCQFVFMEVSSHAIHQNRIHFLQFDGGVFTNLTQDHLDYHKNMLDYLNVKKMFFDNLPSTAFALSNIDDKNGKVMLQNTKASTYTYSVRSLADFKARIFEKHFDGTDIEINGRELSVQFVGRFNVYNLLAVYGVASLLDIPIEDILVRLSVLQPVAGRFQTIRSKSDVTAIIDYAHTPDALVNVLEAINEVLANEGEVITVVGCGGNRDKTKRPIMARESVERSDRVILTSDNPRNEDPQEILNDMLSGLTEQQKRQTLNILDRKEAIKTACNLAKPGDVILVAGKGHETYQDVKGVKHHFDDKEVVEDCFLN